MVSQVRIGEGTLWLDLRLQDERSLTAPIRRRGE
jgi:hypothetical protein